MQPRRASEPRRGPEVPRRRGRRVACRLDTGAARVRDWHDVRRRTSRPAANSPGPRRPPLSSRSSGTASALVTATTPAAHAECLEHAQVLAGLRHHAVVGRDDEQEEVDAGGARDHRPHEPLVARHVDDAHAPPARAGRAARSPARSRCRARAPGGAGRCRRRSARAPGRSCRGRCGPPCRASEAAGAASGPEGGTHGVRDGLELIVRQRAHVQQQRCHPEPARSPAGSPARRRC